MSKSIKEKAKEWGCSESTVWRYCKSGIIPTAEQVGITKKWEIPDDCKKPPLTRHGLCFLLDTIYQVNKGAKFDISCWGYSEEQIKEGFEYLISFAFMTSFEWENAAEQIKHCEVTQRGVDLIEAENKENKSGVKYTAYIKAKATVGVASIETGVEVTNK